MLQTESGVSIAAAIGEPTSSLATSAPQTIPHSNTRYDGGWGTIRTAEQIRC